MIFMNFFQTLNTLDYIILILLLIGLLTGFAQGVIKQAFGLGGLVGGLICGALLYKPAAVFLQDAIDMDDNVAQVVAFIIILIIVPLVFSIVGNLLSKFVKIISLGFVDRLLGGVFGVLKFFIVIGLCIQLLEMTGIVDKVIRSGEKKESRFYEQARVLSDNCLRWTWNKVLPHVEEKDESNGNGTEKII